MARDREREMEGGRKRDKETEGERENVCAVPVKTQRGCEAV